RAGLRADAVGDCDGARHVGRVPDRRGCRSKRRRRGDAPERSVGVQMKQLSLVWLAFVVSAASAGALVPRVVEAQGRPVTAEDYFVFDAVSDPRFSTDGSTVAFVV